MSKRIYILIGILSAFFTACEERVEITSINEETDKLLVECELSTSRRIEANLYTIGNFNQLNKLSYPQDAIIRLGIGIDEELPFKYDEKKQVYYIDSLRHMVNPLYKYRLIAFLKDKEDFQINSKRVGIPIAQKFAISSKPIVSSIKSDKGLELRKIAFEAKVPASKGNEKEFYRINVYRKLYKQVLIDGVSQQIYTGKQETLDFFGNDEIPLAFTKTEFDGSTLFDASRFKDSKFKLNFITKTFQTGDKIETLYYTLETLDESAYRYLIAKQKTINASQNSLSDPVISYTNLQNGYGFLGASSSVVDSLVIK